MSSSSTKKKKPQKLKQDKHGSGKKKLPDWRNPKNDVSIRIEGAKRIATIFAKGSNNRDERREYRILVALEHLCYLNAESREEYTDQQSFEILLHRVASEKAKRRRDSTNVKVGAPPFHEMLKYFLDTENGNKSHLQQQQQRGTVKSDDRQTPAAVANLFKFNNNHSSDQANPYYPSSSSSSNQPNLLVSNANMMPVTPMPMMEQRVPLQQEWGVSEQQGDNQERSIWYPETAFQMPAMSDQGQHETQLEEGSHGQQQVGLKRKPHSELIATTPASSDDEWNVRKIQKSYSVGS